MKRYAFTMLELIFVIIIMGIIGKFGVEFLAQSYKTFIQTTINNELHANSSNALQFIAKRLQYRIAASTIKRIGTSEIFVGVTEVVNNPETYNVIEWIGYDIDGYRGVNKPLWSGIIDLHPSVTTKTQLKTIDTNLTSVNEIINALSNTTSSIADAAIMFNAEDFSPQSFGWNGSSVLANQASSAIHPIKANGDNFESNLGTDFSGMTIYNRYMLAWTAYAIVHDGSKLTLYYNYQPWKGDKFTDGTSQILMENVDTFRIKTNPSGGIFSIILCVNSDLIVGEEHSICKEKIIF